MSGLTEQEILDRHMQSLNEAIQVCGWLSSNADPDRAAPRGRHYSKLKQALKELEGSARQMSHFRADTRWLKLGMIYAKAMRFAQRKFVAQKWLAFQELSKLFELGKVRMDELATVKTGRKLGALLPKRTDWLIMPEHNPPANLWLPQGRMMN